jgi:O-methyltransferase
MISEFHNIDITYKPSFFARMAGLLLPWFQRILPSKFYKLLYNCLYSSYRKSLRVFYFIHVLKAKWFGKMNDAIRTSLIFKLLPYTMGGRKALANAFEVTALIEQKKIDGALVECGVAEGGTAAMMALANRELGTITRPKWFFDSFEGLPEPTADDYKGGKAGYFIQPLSKGTCLGTIEQVKY